MIKIMIVDDMPIFLEYMRGCIDWGSYGFEICCEAHDGKEAMDKMETFYPDVVLTDITMPYINGLDLSKKILETYPDTSIILITGNNEFEYARQAVRIGVCDYLVKPFEKEELILCLLRLRDNVDRALEVKNQKEEIEHTRKEDMLRHLILGHYTEENIGSFQKAGIHFESNYFMVCMMRLHDERMNDVEQVMNWETILVRMIDGILDIDGIFQICTDYENNIVILLNFTTEEAMKSYKVYELQDLAQIVKNQLHLDGTIGISDFCYSPSQINQTYYHTLRLLKDKENEGKGSVLDYKRSNIARDDGSSFYSMDAIEVFNHGLELLNEEMVRKQITEEWERIHRDGDALSDMNFISGILSVLMTNIVTSGRNIEDIYGVDFHPYEDLKHIELPLARRDHLIKLCIKRIQYEKNGVDKRSKAVAESAKEYIASHYQDADMGITDISKFLYLNQTYLRKMFKKEMGLTLSEYITKYRMNKAKEMILNSDDKLTYIAERVGYSDISYFSKCFKKFFGVSPKSLSSK